MGSMSYCIIENTAKDLEEAVEKIRGKLDANEKLSHEEYKYLDLLVSSAQELVSLDKENDLTELKP